MEYNTKVEKGADTMEQINREDMLELTRRMTLKRNCFSRIAGAYLDEEGFVDGTFNRHFLRLKNAEQEENLAIAKKVPFAETNVLLKRYHFSKENEKNGSTWQLLMGLKECELKNDALLDLFYDMAGEKIHPNKQYAVYFFYGTYDIPRKASDKGNQWESEEVYKFIICTFCQYHGDYEVEEPECGFVFPAFRDRSSDIHAIEVYQAQGAMIHREELQDIIGFEEGK